MKRWNNSHRLICARTISFLGSGMYTTCFPLFILHESHSLQDAGLFFALTYLPSVLLLPFLGVFIERFHLKKYLVCSDLFSFLLFSIMLILLSTFGFSMIWLSICTLCFHINDAMFQVASNSIFIHIVPHNEIEKTNGLKSTFDNLSSLLAPLIGTLIYVSMGMELILLFNALSFLISACIITTLRYQEIASKTTTVTPYRTQFIEGLQHIYHNKQICYLFILIMMLNFLVAPTEEIFAPGILQVLYQFDATIYGISSTVFAFSIVVASMYISMKKQATDRKRLRTYFYIQAFLMILTGSCSLLLINTSHTLFLYFYLFQSFLSGIFMTFVNIPLISGFQVMVDQHIQARFFSLLSFFSKLMIPFGTYVAGLNSSLMGADVAYLINGVLMVVVVYVIFRKLSTQKDQGSPTTSAISQETN